MEKRESKNTTRIQILSLIVLLVCVGFNIYIISLNGRFGVSALIIYDIGLESSSSIEFNGKYHQYQVEVNVEQLYGNASLHYSTWDETAYYNLTKGKNNFNLVTSYLEVRLFDGASLIGTMEIIDQGIYFDMEYLFILFTILPIGFITILLLYSSIKIFKCSHSGNKLIINGLLLFLCGFFVVIVEGPNAIVPLFIGDLTLITMMLANPLEVAPSIILETMIRISGLVFGLIGILTILIKKEPNQRKKIDQMSSNLVAFSGLLLILSTILTLINAFFPVTWWYSNYKLTLLSQNVTLSPDFSIGIFLNILSLVIVILGAFFLLFIAYVSSGFIILQGARNYKKYLVEK